MSNDNVVQITYLSGVAKWCKHKIPHKDYNCYTVDVYLDDKSWDKFNGTGSQLKVREDDEGGKFVTFKRVHSKLVKDTVRIYGPPAVVDPEGNDISEQNIGNGSEVTIKIRTYDTQKGKGTEWEKLRVDTLVPYESNIEVDTDIEEPF